MSNISSVSRVTSFTPNLEAGMKSVYDFYLYIKGKCVPSEAPCQKKRCSPLSITKHWIFIKIHLVSNFVAGKKSNIYFGVANCF